MDAKNVKILRGLFLIFVLMVIATYDTLAQCPMCRISLESNLKNGGQTGSGINAGIMYLMATPYLMVGGIAFVWWKNRKKDEDYDLEDQLEMMG